MLTLISFITFATQWALPSRPSAAWGSPPAPERASRLRSRREIPNPSSSDSPSFLLPPDVLLRCSCHSFYKRSCGERKKEPVSFPLNSYVPTPTRVVKGRRISAKGESIALIEFENTEGASSLCRTNKDFPQGNSRDDTFDLPARAQARMSRSIFLMALKRKTERERGEPAPLPPLQPSLLSASKRSMLSTGRLELDEVVVRVEEVTALSFIEVSPCRTCTTATRRLCLSPRGSSRFSSWCARGCGSAVALAAVGTRNYSIFRDGRSQSLRGQGKGREEGWAAREYERASFVVGTLLHDISFGLEFGRTGGLGWHSSVSVCWFVGSSRCLSAGMCRSTGVSSVRPSIERPSGRSKPHLPQNT